MPPAYFFQNVPAVVGNIGVERNYSTKDRVTSS